MDSIKWCIILKNWYIVLLLVVLLISGCTQTAQVETGEEVTDTSLMDLKERGKIVIGTDVPYGVMEFFDENGEIIGLEVDIAKEIASQLGVEAEIIDYAWDDIFTDIKSGKLDIAVSSMTITPERSEEMLFSIPYFNAGQTLVIRGDDETIKMPTDLDGKKVAAQADTTSSEEALKYTDSELVTEYLALDIETETGETIWNQLKSGELDAVIIDYVAAVDYVKQNPSLKIAGEPFTQEFYGIPTKIGNDALMDEINRILRGMKTSGKLKEIEDKWLK